MATNKCTICGGEVMGKRCFRPKCRENWRKHWENRVHEKIVDYQRQVKLLNSYESSSLNLEDYSKLKKIEKEVKKWESELQTSPVKSEIEKLLQDIGRLEAKFPEKIKLKQQGESKDCSHKNIHWLDFFQKDKTEEPYCLDCREDENKKFTKAFQRWYCKEVRNWLKTNNLKDYRFDKFLKKNNFYNKWQGLERGETFENIKDEFFIFQEMNKLIEDYLLEFAEEQENNDDSNRNDNREREREREREQNYSRISLI